jgi:hypothetical protein
VDALCMVKSLVSCVCCKVSRVHLLSLVSLSCVRTC